MLLEHRVGGLQTFKEPKKWRFVPGRMNQDEIKTWSLIYEVILSE